MKSIIAISLLLVATNADIGLKLRQQQEYLQQSRGDVRNNPFFIPNSDGRNFGNIGAAATNVEQSVKSGAKTERTHTLEELCNDAFHSFLCKPVNGAKRRRIDGNLRPGAVIPPGVLSPESSNTRENKLLPPQPSNSSPIPNKVRPDQQSDRVPAAQSEQGYFYPRPSNSLEVNRPLKNGYLPPDNSFRYTPPPTQSTIRFSPVTTRLPQTTRLPPVTFPTTTRRPVVTFQTTPRPIFTTRIPTTPSTIFPQPVKLATFPPRQQIFNTYLPPATIRTSQPLITTRAPFFTTPPPSTVIYTTRRPLQTFAPIISTTPAPRITTTFRPSTQPPVTFITSTPKYNTISNTYLPPFAEQKFNPVVLPKLTTTPRPTIQTVTIPSFQTISPTLTNTYLPPENPAIDIRFGSASGTKTKTLLPEATQNADIAVKEDTEDNLERLCNDPFHSFLCQPITKTRYRFDGRLRPQAVIPSGIVASTNIINAQVKGLPSLQPETSGFPSNSVNIYSSPNLQNSQVLFGFVPITSSLKLQQQPLLQSAANDNSVINTGYVYSPPTSNLFDSFAPSSLSASQTGYVYPKPSSNQPFTVVTSTESTTRPEVTEQFSTVTTTVKPLIDSNQLLNAANILSFQKTNNQQFLITSTEKAQTGYEYPKPSYTQQLTLPPSTPRPQSLGYVYPKADTQFIYTTSTPTPNNVFETTTLTSSDLNLPTSSPITLFTGYENTNPSIKQGGVTVTTTERPSTLGYVYNSPTISQLTPSLAPQTFINYQQAAQNINSNGYFYPKPDVQFQQEQTITNNANGYFYSKPSIPFPDTSLNSIGNGQFFKSETPTFNSFSKGAQPPSFSSFPSFRQPSSQQSSDQNVDPKAAKNINQLLGPSVESNSKDLPPASQFEILKVRKRQNG